MTVITQVKQTLAGLKSAQASLETFSLGTDNQEAKQCMQMPLNKHKRLLIVLSHGFNKSNKKNLNIINKYLKKSGWLFANRFVFINKWEGEKMTVISNVKQTIATLKGIEAQLSILALNSQEEKAQNTFHDMMLLIEEVKNDLHNRQVEMELEEPQYKQS